MTDTTTDTLPAALQRDPADHLAALGVAPPHTRGDLDWAALDLEEGIASCRGDAEGARRARLAKLGEDPTDPYRAGRIRALRTAIGHPEFFDRPTWTYEQARAKIRRCAHGLATAINTRANLDFQRRELRAEARRIAARMSPPDVAGAVARARAELEALTGRAS